MTGIITIPTKLIQSLIVESRQSDGKRAFKTIRSSDKNPTPAIMLNAFQVGTYIQPHKHPNSDGREIWIPYVGVMHAVFFDNDGNITNHYKVSREYSEPQKEVSFLEIPANTFHTLIPQAESAICELYLGVYNADSYKKFALWAPSEQDTKEKRNSYLESVLAKIS